MSIKTAMKFAIPTAALSAMPAVAMAAENLAQDDFVGISFWLISMALWLQQLSSS